MGLEDEAGASFRTAAMTEQRTGLVTLVQGKGPPPATKAQSRFASVVLDGVLGSLRLACHT